MKLELTDQQEQAVKQGHAVEVVDPTTTRTFILVAAEVFAKLRPTLSHTQELAQSGSGPSAPASNMQPLRQLVRDLALPPEVAAEAKRYCKRLGLWGAKSRREMEEQMKIQHYYGGLWIAFLRTGKGPLVVAAAESLDTPSFDQQLSFLTAEERRGVLFDSPGKLFDEDSEILTPFSDES